MTRGIDRGIETQSPPIAIHNTKAATTIEKVNWDDPKERPDRRISVVSIVIIANPSSRATKR